MLMRWYVERRRFDYFEYLAAELRGALAYYPIILIVVISLILRMYLRSNYLDDWDSIQFALALDNYSIALHQPHPPGYPVYVFLGRLVHLVIPNTTDSLVYLSILFGTLSIIAIYILARKFFGEIVGAVSALNLIFLIAHRNDLKTCILSIILFSISVCAWLIPTIIDTGLHTFIELQRSQGAYAVSTSTLNSLGGFGLINLAKTVKQFMILLISGWSMSLLIFSAISLTFFTYNKQKILRSYRDIRILILVYLLLTYFIFSIFYYNLYIVRYLLPLFAPMVIIISYALSMAV